MKLIFFLILSCLTFAQEVRFQKDGDTTNVYNTGLTTPAEIVAGRKNVDSLFLSPARFKDNVSFDSAATFRNGVFNLIEYTTFEEYGAIGDGATNDSAAVVNALKSGKPVKGVSGRTYLVNNATQISLTGYNINLSSTGNEPFTIRFGNLVNGFLFSGTQKTSGNLFADSVIIGVKYQVFTTVADVDTGDLLVYLSPAGDYWTGLDTSNHIVKHDLHLVNRISNDTVWTDAATWDTYDASTGSHPATVYVFTPITVKMKNVIFEYTGSTSTDNILALRINYSKFNLLEDVTVNYSRYSGIQLWYAYQGSIVRPRINYCDYAGLGYGIYLAACFGVTVEGGYFNECRSATDGGTNISRANIIRNNTVTTDDVIGASRGFGIHAQSQNWTIENNIIYNASTGIVFAGEGHLIRNNRIFNVSADPIYIGQSKNITIDGNILETFYGDSRYPVGYPATFIRIISAAESDANSRTIIKNNVGSCYSRFITLERDMYNMEVSNNVINFQSSIGSLFYNTTSDTIYYSDIRNNQMTRNTAYGTALLTTGSTFGVGGVTFINSYTQFNNSINTTVSGDWVFTGNIEANGTDLDSLANVVSYLNVAEDTTITSLVTNGTCEGTYTAGLAPDVTLSGIGSPYTYITATEQAGLSGTDAQGFSSDAQLSNGNISWKAANTITDGVLHKLTFYAKIISNATTHRINIKQGNLYSTPFTLTTSYQKFEYSYTPEATINAGSIAVYFGNYVPVDSAVVFALDNIEIRPVQTNITYTNINLDSTIVFTDIDSIPYSPTRPKLGSISGELKAKDSAGNEIILTNMLAGTDTFTTTATVDTVTNADIAATNIFTVSINDATPVANDLLSWMAEAGRLLVFRPTGTTSGLKYSYMRIK